MNVKQVSWGYNANLGRFTNFVNLMDMAGIAIPSGLLQCEISSMLVPILCMGCLLLLHHERHTISASNIICNLNLCWLISASIEQHYFQTATNWSGLHDLWPIAHANVCASEYSS